MHVYFISHLFFLAYLLNIRLTKLRISFLLLKKKKKLILELLKKS